MLHRAEWNKNNPMERVFTIILLTIISFSGFGQLKDYEDLLYLRKSSFGDLRTFLKDRNFNYEGEVAKDTHAWAVKLSDTSGVGIFKYPDGVVAILTGDKSYVFSLEKTAPSSMKFDIDAYQSFVMIKYEFLPYYMGFCYDPHNSVYKIVIQ